MKKLLILLSVIVVITGCSNRQQAPIIEETQTGEIAPGAMKDKKGGAQDPVPHYISESEFEGDELGIVKSLNLMVKAVYERDVDAYNMLMTKGADQIIEGTEFNKYFISIDKLDFSVQPDPTPPEDVKPVLLEYTEIIYGYKDTEEDKQLFLFRLEDGIWKLVTVADRW